MLLHRPAARSSSLSRNVFLTWKKLVLGHHVELIRSNSRLPVVLRCSLFAQGRKGGKDRKRSGTGRFAAKGSGKAQSPKDFDYLMKLPLEFRANFHEKFHKNEICYGFQKKTCKRIDGTCKFSHICVGCGGSKPYNDCKCLTAKLP